MLNDEEINDFRQLLEYRLAETRNALQATVTETVTLDQTRIGRLSRMDAMQQQAMAAGLKERVLRNEKRLLAALDRIRAGTFGVCCECGDAVAPHRLEADPVTPFCGDCQNEIEANK